MDPNLELWLEYLLRFSHLVAGIAWIGSSFYFIWLDSSFEAPERPRHNVEGELFMVHGGFYYQVEKKKIRPGELPKTLHWFKWEATLTWITGILLLTLLYYLRGASLLVNPEVLALTQLQAVGLSLGLIFGAWLAYDFIWSDRFPLGAVDANPLSFWVRSLLTLLGFSFLTYLHSQIFSGRGAFIQTGATLGSLMLFNVWIRILPGQSKMLKAAQNGQTPDYSLSLKSKTRSVHNTYFTFPVLFIMISNHYPSIYGHPHKALALILLSAAGALTRHAMVCKSTRERWVLAPAAAFMLALILLTAQIAPQKSLGTAKISYLEVRGVIQTHCLSCHAQTPTDSIFQTPPKGLILESEAQVRASAAKIIDQAVLSKTMPLGNKTQMTDEERSRLGAWLRPE